MPGSLPGTRSTRAGPDPFRGPAGDHLVAERVVAERGDVIDADAEAGEIDGGVERIAAIAAREQAAVGLLQLDHAFADAGYLAS